MGNHLISWGPMFMNCGFFFAYSFFSFIMKTKSFIISFRRGCKYVGTNITKIKPQQILMIP